MIGSHISVYGEVQGSGFRSWAKEQEGRFKAVIPGENYNAFNKDAVDMRSELSNKQDRDFNNRNSGVTIFWL